MRQDCFVISQACEVCTFQASKLGSANFNQMVNLIVATIVHGKQPRIFQSA